MEVYESSGGQTLARVATVINSHPRLTRHLVSCVLKSPAFIVEVALPIPTPTITLKDLTL